MGWETVLALVLSLLVLCFLIRVRKDEADRRGFLTLYVVLLALMIGLASLTPGDFPNQTAIGAMFLVMSDSVIMKAKPMMILKVPETAATLLGQIMGLAMILMWVIEQT